MNQSTIIAAVVLAAILAASTVVMALPWESAEASTVGDVKGGRGGDADVRQRGGDTRIGDFESDGSGNEGNLAEGGNAVGTATGGAGGEATGGAGSTEAAEEEEEE